MIKIFIGELIPELPYTEILYPNLGNKERETPFGESIFKEFTVPVVEIVPDIESADYLCLPHNYNYVKNNAEYLLKFIELSEKSGKKIIIFFPGDSDEDVPIPNSIIFRNSQYKHKKHDNEVIMPAYAVDLGKKYGLLERPKAPKAVVGFCGWASYKSIQVWVSYGIFNLMQSLVGNPLFKKGLYFRRRAMAFLKKSDKVTPNFIIRSSYSGNSKTLTVDPKAARTEYVDNIKNSDFTLAPKGDGNFSVRFFESLSLGRIPLLIDTDCPLPLEDEINYDEFILRVNSKELHLLGDKVSEFYNSLTPEQYKEKQRKCREIFEKYLKIDVFLAQAMNKEFLL
jgi:hypothetical protein